MRDMKLMFIVALCCFRIPAPRDGAPNLHYPRTLSSIYNPIETSQLLRETHDFLLLLFRLVKLSPSSKLLSYRAGFDSRTSIPLIGGMKTLS